MILVWAWAKAHWKPLGALAALALAFGAGWLAHRPQPAITSTTSVVAQAAAAEQKDEHKAVASRDIAIEIGSPVFDMGRLAGHDPTQDPTPDHVTRPAMPIIPQCVTEFSGLPPGSRVTIHEGPSTEDVRSASQSSSASDSKTSLTIAPASSPRWAVGGGFLDPLGARQVHLEAGMRLLGPFWLRVGSTPARGLAGTTVGAEIQFQ